MLDGTDMHLLLFISAVSSASAQSRFVLGFWCLTEFLPWRLERHFPQIRGFFKKKDAMMYLFPHGLFPPKLRVGKKCSLCILVRGVLVSATRTFMSI